MKYLIKPVTELDSSEVTGIYEIHKRLYFDKGIGLNRNDWGVNLLKKYHDKVDKQVFLFFYGPISERIEGYLVLTDSVKHGDCNFSKLLEGGIDTSLYNDKTKAFIAMFQELTRNGIDNSTYYFTEIGVDYRSILYLLNQAGFNHFFDKAMADELLDQFLLKGSYLLINKSHVMIERKTLYESNFLGYLLTNMK